MSNERASHSVESAVRSDLKTAAMNVVRATMALLTLGGAGCAASNAGGEGATAGTADMTPERQALSALGVTHKGLQPCEKIGQPIEGYGKDYVCAVGCVKDTKIQLANARAENRARADLSKLSELTKTAITFTIGGKSVTLPVMAGNLAGAAPIVGVGQSEDKTVTCRMVSMPLGGLEQLLQDMSAPAGKESPEGQW